MTALLFNGFFNGFGIPQPLCTMVFDGRPQSLAKGCDSHTSFRSRWGEGEIFPIYYNCQFWGVGGRIILGFLSLDLTIAVSKLFFRHFYEEWHSGFCEGLLISKTFDWQGIKQWQRRNLPSEKEKIQFWRKTPLFRGFYAPRLPEREEGVWGVGEIAGIPGEENPLPFFPPFLLSQTFFLLLARLCPPLNLQFFRQLKLFRVRRLPWNPGLNHLKNVLI